MIAADIVEVAPAYDTNAELTTMAAAVSSFYKIGEEMLTEYRMCCTKS